MRLEGALFLPLHQGETGSARRETEWKSDACLDPKNFKNVHFHPLWFPHFGLLKIKPHDLGPGD